MIESMISSGSYVVIAVGFDDHTESLVRFGGALARKLGKKVALVHSAEVPIVQEPVRPFAVPALVWEKIPELVAASREELKKQLGALKTRLLSDLDVKLIVKEGQAAEVLAKEAEDLNASLLIVGTSVKPQSFVPRGFSTALTLMASAKVPVLAVDTERHLPDLSLPFRVLVADDLSPQSEPAVQAAATLAEACRASWLQHLHVSAFSKENLETTLRQAAAAAHTSLSAIEAEEVYKAVQAEQRAALEDRFSDYREYFEASGGRYTAEVVPGQLRAELDAAVKTHLPDIMVFGRHHTVHRKPFFFGRMPYKAMMAFGRPVLIVPGADE
jgi:nucleotide-binding universal stress UspA family protein